MIEFVHALLDKHAAQAAQQGKENNMGSNAVAQPSTAQKVEDSIDEVAAVLSSVMERFGHPTVASAIATGDALVPVFTGLVDSIMALFKHKQTLAG
jgi:hypothetical protein